MRFFFVTGLGRSGSSFLAHLLDRAQGSCVAHEPFPDDFNYLPVARCGHSSRAVASYLEHRRARIEASLPQGVELYGEVNSLLRYCVPELREVFDDPFIALLARNGRDFVRSAYVRSVYTDHPTHAHVVPDDDDPWADRWRRFGRFEKLCWYWNHTNRSLLERSLPVLRLEHELRDLDALRRQLLDPVGLQVSEETFLALRDRRRNTSADYLGNLARGRWWRRLRGRRDDEAEALGPWTEDREAVFQSICGETMTELGYA